MTEVENAARGRRPRAAFSRPRSQFFHYTDRPKPVNNLFIFFPLSQTTLFTHGKKTHASVTVTVVRDRKIRTALRTNQIAKFVTVTAWKKIMIKKTLLQLFSLCVFPKLQIFDKIFCTNLQRPPCRCTSLGHQHGCPKIQCKHMELTLTNYLY